MKIIYDIFHKRIEDWSFAIFIYLLYLYQPVPKICSANIYLLDSNSFGIRRELNEPTAEYLISDSS